jgi:uncharacterized protein YndB with AHSA1/START domain
MTTTDDRSGASVVIERTLDAPADLVWQMWTEPRHFEAWYGPDGARIAVARMDVRVGGDRLVRMEMATPEGTAQMWFAGEHTEVVDGQRLVYTESISDEHGNVAAPTDGAIAEGHPATTVVTVELHDLGGRTRMVMTHAGVPADSPGAMGWTMALDKLEGHLAGVRRRD